MDTNEQLIAIGHEIVQELRLLRIAPRSNTGASRYIDDDGNAIYESWELENNWDDIEHRPINPTRPSTIALSGEDGNGIGCS